MSTPGASSGLRPAMVYRAVALAAALAVVGLVVQQLMTLCVAAVMVLIISLPLSASRWRWCCSSPPKLFGIVGMLIAIPLLSLSSRGGENDDPPEPDGKHWPPQGERWGGPARYILRRDGRTVEREEAAWVGA